MCSTAIPSCSVSTFEMTMQSIMLSIAILAVSLSAVLGAAVYAVSETPDSKATTVTVMIAHTTH